MFKHKQVFKNVPRTIWNELKLCKHVHACPLACGRAFGATLILPGYQRTSFHKVPRSWSQNRSSKSHQIAPRSRSLNGFLETLQWETNFDTPEVSPECPEMKPSTSPNLLRGSQNQVFDSFANASQKGSQMGPKDRPVSKKWSCSWLRIRSQNGCNANKEPKWDPKAPQYKFGTVCGPMWDLWILLGSLFGVPFWGPMLDSSLLGIVGSLLPQMGSCLADGQIVFGGLSND